MLVYACRQVDLHPLLACDLLRLQPEVAHEPEARYDNGVHIAGAAAIGGMTMNLKRYGSIAALSAVVAVGGTPSISLAATHPHAAAQVPYGCTIHPNKANCKTGVGGTRVTGGANGNKGKTGGTRSGGATGKGTTGNGTNGQRGKGANALGAGANGKGAKGAGANGSSPVPGNGLPVTGFGGTAQDLGASPRASAAGTQAVVVGLASFRSSKGVTSLPATGGGLPSQPLSPLLAFLACGLAVLGLGLRKVAVHL
jgi:hypothetical protein